MFFQEKLDKLKHTKATVDEEKQKLKVIEWSLVIFDYK